MRDPFLAVKFTAFPSSASQQNTFLNCTINLAIVGLLPFLLIFRGSFLHNSLPSLLCAGQYSSEGESDIVRVVQKTSEPVVMQHLTPDASAASISSIRSDPKLKALMRDELLINVQKFSSQVTFTPT